MDMILHTAIAMGCMVGSYCLARNLTFKSCIDPIATNGLANRVKMGPAVMRVKMIKGFSTFEY